MQKFTYKHEFDFIYGENTFVPTSTSEVLLESIVSDNQELGKTLDLGTGIGFVIIMLKLIKGDLVKECFASDLSGTNISYCKQNSTSLKVPVEIKQGSLFQPWKNYKFDTIINDVSGVVPLIAEKSGWFKGVPIDCGLDGADLTVQIINEAANHLSERGKIYTPVLSLQNEKRIYQAIVDNGFQYKALSSHYWPVPDSVAQNVEMIDSLINADIVRIDKKFGKLFWYTTIIKIERSTL